METDKKFKAIVFDFGGVIELRPGGSLLNDVAGIIGVSIADFKAEYFKHNHRSNVDNIPWEQMVLEVVAVFDPSEETRHRVLSLSEEYQSRKIINTELVALFTPLRTLGYQVAILSNATSNLREKLIKNGIAPLVDEIVVSGEIGFQKPHKEAFDVLFERLHVRPEEVIFIDDAQKSLEKAAEIGYTPILFKDNNQLRTALHKLGIPL